jgi:hypothetical protein
MGQYANQPDFITNDIKLVTPVAVGSLTAADSLNGSILYIGTSTANDTLEVIPVGATGSNGKGLPGQAQAIVFKNPPQGEWFPVAVDYVLAGNTSVSSIVAGK